MKLERIENIDFVKVFFIIGTIVFAILWLRGCGAPQTPQLVEVTVPKVQGSFTPQKPVSRPVNIQAVLPKNDKSKIDKVENPINQKLVAENEALKLAFAKETDSLKKLLAYEKAVELNNFSTKFEDDNLELNIEGVVQGEVKEVTPSYVIKEKKIAVKEKQVILRVLGGVEVGNTPVLDNFQAKANLMFQNRKGNVFSASMDTRRIIWVGYSASLFNFKR